MLKYLLTGCCCLSILFCRSQELEAIDQQYREMDSAVIAESLQLQVLKESRVQLSWKSAVRSVEYYCLERSSNGLSFETMAVLKQADTGVRMEWVDEQPGRGKNVYRIRCNFSDGSLYYSRAITAVMGNNLSFRFYPNPVDNVLIVRSEQAVDLVILDGNGKTRLFKSQISGLQMLNVSGLERGVYLVRVLNKITGQLVQEKLVKN